MYVVRIGRIRVWDRRGLFGSIYHVLHDYLVMVRLWYWRSNSISDLFFFPAGVKQLTVKPHTSGRVLEGCEEQANLLQ